jgi:hypothetical protein
MSNPNTFMTNLVAATQTLISAMDQLAQYNDMVAQDGTLVTRYFDNTGNPSHRTDIAAADVTAALAAAGQVAFAFNSGNPPQKAALYKLLP